MTLAELEQLTEEERAVLVEMGKDRPGGAAVVKALSIIEQQATLIGDADIVRMQDEVAIRRLELGRFSPAERAVLEACGEMLLVPEAGRVHVADARDIELVAEAEWAKRQEHGLADREDGLEYVLDPERGRLVRRNAREGVSPVGRDRDSVQARAKLAKLGDLVNDQAIESLTVPRTDDGAVLLRRLDVALSLLHQVRELLEK